MGDTGVLHARTAAALYWVGSVVMAVAALVVFGTEVDAGPAWWLGVGLVVAGVVVGPPPLRVRLWGAGLAIAGIVLGALIAI
jgi:hypothetical protein